jgi:DHA1 family multidrug resistance protein-like MFS transporter
MQAISPAILTLLVAQFVTFVGISFVFPLLPLYVAELGVSDPGEVAAWAGFLGALTPLCAGIFVPFWSHRAERHGLRPLLLQAMIAYAVIIGAMGFVTSVWQLAGLRALYGVMGGLSAILAGALSKIVPEERLGRTLGLMQTVMSVAFALGPFLGGITKDAFGFKATFAVVSVLCLLGALLIAVGFKEPAPQQAAPKPAMSGRERLRRAMRLVGPMMLIMAIAQLAVNSFEILLPLVVQRFAVAADATASWAGAAMSAIGIATIGSALLMGWMADRFGAARVLAAGFAGGIASAAGLALSGTPGMLTLFCGVWGLFTGGIPAVVYALAASRVGAEERIPMLAWIGSASAFGIAAGPLIGGLIGKFSLGAVFGLSAAFCLLGVAISWFSAPAPPSVDEASIPEPTGYKPVTQAARPFN